MSHHPPQTNERKAKAVAVCATGPSMTDEVVEIVRDTFTNDDCKIAAVSDSYILFPGADIVVASDYNWWNHHQPDVPEFKCYAANQSANKLLGLNVVQGLPSSINSTALAIEVATRLYRPDRIYIFGADCHNEKGYHFFGSHPPGLKNTTDKRFEKIVREIQEVSQSCIARGVHVLSCTEGSALHYGSGNIPPVVYTNEIPMTSGLGVN